MSPFLLPLTQEILPLQSEQKPVKSLQFTEVNKRERENYPLRIPKADKTGKYTWAN
jgi:hypothetical protein